MVATLCASIRESSAGRLRPRCCGESSGIAKEEREGREEEREGREEEGGGRGGGGGERGEGRWGGGGGMKVALSAH